MKIGNKIKKTASVVPWLSCTTTLRAIYSAKSYYLLLSSHLSFLLVINNAFPFYLLLSPLSYSICTFMCYPPSPALFSSFRSIFSYFYRFAYTTNINHHSCTPFSYIFTLDHNFGSFVSSLPGGLPFLLFSSFFFIH
jgi:hypothetical protein